MEKELDDLIYRLSLDCIEKTPIAPVVLKIWIINFEVPQQDIDNAKSIFSNWVITHGLFRLCAITKQGLRTFLIEKGNSSINDSTRFQDLIKELRKWLKENKKNELLYIADIIDSLRIVRNHYEYKEGILGNLKGDEKILHLMFPIINTFALDPKGKKHIIETTLGPLPENSSLNIETILQKKTYTIGEKIDLPSRKNIFRASVIIRSLLFNRGLEISTDYTPTLK